MIKAIIIDDEQHCISALQHDLAMFCPNVTVVATCNSGKNGILAINMHKPDLVFLDIEMPLMDGFEMLAQLEGMRSFELIFTTAYNQFVMRALRLSAVDYLLKPIDNTELSLAIGRVEKQLRKNENTGQRIDNLVLNNSLDAEKQKIALPQRDGYEFISPSEILYCKAEGGYTEIVLATRKLLISKPLGEIEAALPKSIFIRIHYSAAVNISYIAQLKKNNGHSVIMFNGEILNVARSKKDELLLKLGLK